jgi:hypothetical protein
VTSRQTELVGSFALPHPPDCFVSDEMQSTTPKEVAADACRVVAPGAKTGEEALNDRSQENLSLVTSAATKEDVFERTVLKPVLAVQCRQGYRRRRIG